MFLKRYQNDFLIIGTVIGAGIFSLPVALMQAGSFVFMLMLIVLAGILAIINIFYRDIIEHIPQRHQLPGYTRIILGERMARFAVLTLYFATSGSLLAYLIIGGQFIANMLPLTPREGSGAFIAVVLGLIIFGGSRLAAFDAIFAIVKLILIGSVIILAYGVWGFGHISGIAHIGPNPQLAYGSILFALTGVSIMPELQKASDVRRSIWAASGIIAGVYVLFAFAYAGYITENGVAVSHVLFDLAGLFTVLTPYMMLSWVAYDLLHKDLNINRLPAIALTHSLPIAAFLLGMKNFLEVISLTGGVFLGYIVLIITTAYAKLFPRKHSIALRIIQTIFLIGICLEIWQFFVGS